jgi:hypothetical protein
VFIIKRGLAVCSSFGEDGQSSPKAFGLPMNLFHA